MSEPSRDAVAKALKWFDSDHFLPSHEGCVLAREVRRLEARVTELEAEVAEERHTVAAAIEALEQEMLKRRGAAPDGLLRELRDYLYFGESDGLIENDRSALLAKIDAALSALLDAPRETKR